MIAPMRAVAVLALLAVAACSKDPKKPTAGLLAAGQPLLLVTDQGKRPIAVGATLRTGDKVEASGPAVLEFFGGAVRFLDDGDSFEVGDVPEAKVHGDTVPAQMLKDGALVERPPQRRIIAARYHSVTFTPPSQSKELTSGDYFKAFFTPDGISKLKEGVAKGEGPRRDLPAPPHRSKVPHVHAGDLGQGGLRIAVSDGYVVAECDDLATAILPEGQLYDLGRTTRLLLPDGAEARLAINGDELDLEGPADIRLR